MMQKTAVMTDSNCGILPEQGKELGITIVPMPIIIDGKTYFEGVDLTVEEFYRLQGEGAEITSSLPSQEYEGRVHVVDNHRISVTQIQAVLDEAEMARRGMNGKEIKDRLESEALDASIYIAVDTLEYLKKGGRVTAAGAAIGSTLNIKPVLTIDGDKLDAYAKVRGMKSAFRTMCKALRKDIDGKLKSLHENGELVLGIANTLMPEEELEQWKEELKKAFPEENILHGALNLSIGCHVGPGALGIGAVRRLK